MVSIGAGRRPKPAKPRPRPDDDSRARGSHRRRRSCQGEVRSPTKPAAPTPGREARDTRETGPPRPAPPSSAPAPPTARPTNGPKATAVAQPPTTQITSQEDADLETSSNSSFSAKMCGRPARPENLVRPTRDRLNRGAKKPEAPPAAPAPTKRRTSRTPLAPKNIKQPLAKAAAGRRFGRDLAQNRRPAMSWRSARKACTTRPTALHAHRAARRCCGTCRSTSTSPGRSR